MGQLGSMITKMAPPLMEMGGTAATAMGHPELGVPLQVGGSVMGGGSGAMPGIGGSGAPGGSPMGSMLGNLGQIAQTMFVNPQGQPQQQLPPMQPRPQPPQIGPGTPIGAPGMGGGMGGGGAQPPQAAGMMGGPQGGGVGAPSNPMADPQFAAKIRQMLMGGMGMPGMG
jgi:hypothetical protein